MSAIAAPSIAVAVTAPQIEQKVETSPIIQQNYHINISGHEHISHIDGELSRQTMRELRELCVLLDGRA